ncbi:MAG: DUF4364 family protein [Oscillospiraceae bacterium]|nr:DUF4364 family protein [Oscillospiraceae bacterium]
MDIKILVLYLLDRVEYPIDFSQLTDLSLCDGGVDYFEFVQAVSGLVETGHVRLENQQYAITDKGRRDGRITQDQLAFSLRRKCDGNLERMNARLRLENQARAEILPRAEGGVALRANLEDSRGGLMALEMYCPTQKQAEDMVAAFRRDPHRIYRAVLAAFSTQEEPHD